MNTYIFDPDYLETPIDITPKQAQGTTPEFHTPEIAPFRKKDLYWLQKMGVHDNGRLGHYDMYDASYPTNVHEAYRDMEIWFKNKTLILIETPEIELVCHSSVITSAIEQVNNILSGTLTGLLHYPYESDEWKSYFVLVNRYFFSQETGHGRMFLKELQKK